MRGFQLLLPEQCKMLDFRLDCQEVAMLQGEHQLPPGMLLLFEVDLDLVHY